MAGIGMVGWVEDGPAKLAGILLPEGRSDAISHGAKAGNANGPADQAASKHSLKMRRARPAFQRT